MVKLSLAPLIVTPVNDAPTLDDQSATLAEDGSFNLDLSSLGCDTDLVTRGSWTR